MALFLGRLGSVLSHRASLFDRIVEIAGEGGARNAKQFCRLPLASIGVVIDEADMPFDGAVQREIGVPLRLFVVAGWHRSCL